MNFPYRRFATLLETLCRWSIQKRVLSIVLAVVTATIALRIHTLLAQEPQYDLLIVGGHIIDGSGSPWFEGSVAVKDGKIADVGRLVNATASRVIDAKGLVVGPGFIDLHSHSDRTLLADGKAQSEIRQGVTTEILGEDHSAAPVPPGAGKNLKQYGLIRDWTTLGEYFARLERQGISVNIASYVGSGQVREVVLGEANRAPNPAELEKMKSLVDQAMREGAIGLASGLIYLPNAYAQTDELIELAKVAAKYGGIYTTHMRGEGAHWKSRMFGPALGVAEDPATGSEAGLPAHILHLKIDGKPNWGQMTEQVKEIQAARDRGADITANQYPYIASMTDLETCLPPKYLAGSPADEVKRLQDPEVRAEIRQAIATGLPGWEVNQVKSVGGWHGVMVAAMLKPENKKYEGKRMDEVAKLMGKDPVDAVCDLFVSEGGEGDAIYFNMSDQDVESAMKQPWVGIGSDGGAASPEMTFLGRRFYGTFPRVLGVYVREKHVLTLPDAVRKMTALSAAVTGLNDRGLLRPGMAADITLFDPQTVIDRATFENPMQYPVGIPYVIVNGTVVIDQGKHTGAMPGHVLRGRGRKNVEQ